MTRELASDLNYAAISCLLPDRAVQTDHIWVGVDGGRLYVDTEPHRQTSEDLERDPRVTLAVRDESNPYRYAEGRGRVVGTERGQSARDQIDQLSQEYDGPLPTGADQDRAGHRLDRAGTSDHRRLIWRPVARHRVHALSPSTGRRPPGPSSVAQQRIGAAPLRCSDPAELSYSELMFDP